MRRRPSIRVGETAETVEYGRAVTMRVRKVDAVNELVEGISTDPETGAWFSWVMNFHAWRRARAGES